MLEESSEGFARKSQLYLGENVKHHIFSEIILISLPASCYRILICNFIPSHFSE